MVRMVTRSSSAGVLHQQSPGQWQSRPEKAAVVATSGTRGGPSETTRDRQHDAHGPLRGTRAPDLCEPEGFRCIAGSLRGHNGIGGWRPAGWAAPHVPSKGETEAAGARVREPGLQSSRTARYSGPLSCPQPTVQAQTASWPVASETPGQLGASANPPSSEAIQPSSLPIHAQEAGSCGAPSPRQTTCSRPGPHSRSGG